MPRISLTSNLPTSLGKLSTGDELVGLTRAFIYAGTPVGGRRFVEGGGQLDRASDVELLQKSQNDDES